MACVPTTDIITPQPHCCFHPAPCSLLHKQSRLRVPRCLHCLRTEIRVKGCSFGEQTGCCAACFTMPHIIIKSMCFLLCYLFSQRIAKTEQPYTSFCNTIKGYACLSSTPPPAETKRTVSPSPDAHHPSSCQHMLDGLASVGFGCRSLLLTSASSSCLHGTTVE